MKPLADLLAEMETAVPRVAAYPSEEQASHLRYGFATVPLRLSFDSPNQTPYTTHAPNGVPWIAASATSLYDLAVNNARLVAALREAIAENKDREKGRLDVPPLDVRLARILSGEKP